MISDFDNIPALPAIFGPARQVAYMVEDIDTAMSLWHEIHGVGPFLVTRTASTDTRDQWRQPAPYPGYQWQYHR